jgi:hypothetical protein
VITLDPDALPYGDTICSVPRPSWLQKVDIGMEDSILTMTSVAVRGGSQTIMVWLGVAPARRGGRELPVDD